VFVESGRAARLSKCPSTYIIITKTIWAKTGPSRKGLFYVKGQITFVLELHGQTF